MSDFTSLFYLPLHLLAVASYSSEYNWELEEGIKDLGERERFPWLPNSDIEFPLDITCI